MTLKFEGKREVRITTDVDRNLANRVDAVARQHGVHRAEVVRRALEHALAEA